jgi:hypothetical protein
VNWGLYEYLARKERSDVLLMDAIVDPQLHRNAFSIYGVKRYRQTGGQRHYNSLLIHLIESV